MLGQDLSVAAAAAAGATQIQPARPQPEQRVVEGTGKSRLPDQETASMLAQPPSALQQLSSSARQFADILDSTGNVQLAASISGFRGGYLDVYA
jgi:hypothetical protein